LGSFVWYIRVLTTKGYSADTSTTDPMLGLNPQANAADASAARPGRLAGAHDMTRAARRARVGALALVFAIASTAGDRLASAPEQQAPTFRSGVEYVVVDAQVIDDEGRPLDRLRPEQFEVSIGGGRRRVVSAQFIRNAPTDLVAPEARGPTGGSAPAADGRVFMVAIDEASFDIRESRGIAGAVREFIAALQPHDLVGLYSYPLGPKFRPTRNHAALISRLIDVVGSRQHTQSEYHLTPVEVIDITAHAARSALAPGAESETFALTDLNATDALRAVQQRECTGDPRCAANIQQEALSMAFEYENSALRSLYGLRVLVSGLAAYPGRKTVVVMSGGMVVSDRPGGRPDVGELPKILGQEAAQANIAIYALQLDDSFLQAVSARTASADFGAIGDGRNADVRSRLMSDFSYASGGAFIPVLTGAGENVLRRVLRETSAHYLLAVEPEDSDRDGRLRELRVRVRAEDATVRSRSWVVVPERN
jgi:VWFA-related protein